MKPAHIALAAVIAIVVVFIISKTSWYSAYSAPVGGAGPQPTSAAG